MEIITDILGDIPINISFPHLVVSLKIINYNKYLMNEKQTINFKAINSYLDQIINCEILEMYFCNYECLSKLTKLKKLVILNNEILFKNSVFPNNLPNGLEEVHIKYPYNYYFSTKMNNLFPMKLQSLNLPSSLKIFCIINMWT